MFKKKYRLKKKKEIEKIFKKGSLITGKFVIIRFLKEEKESPLFKVAVFVGKKYSKLATQRNRARRLIWKILAEVLPRFNQYLNHSAIIFIVKNNALGELEKNELRKDLIILLKKIKENLKNPQEDFI